MRRWIAILAASFCLAAAADPGERLADPGQEARARAIFADVRCLVCQNESIDDSQAELAADLRRLVRDEIKAGKSDAEVRTYLTDRYGEFVLLTPAISWANAALWVAPILILALGGLLLARSLKRARSDPDLTEEEAFRLARLTSNDLT